MFRFVAVSYFMTDCQRRQMIKVKLDLETGYIRSTPKGRHKGFVEVYVEGFCFLMNSKDAHNILRLTKESDVKKD